MTPFRAFVPVVLLVVGLAVLYGCGGTRTVVRTQVVKPCATPAKAASGEATVRVSCVRYGHRFSCVVLRDYTLLGTSDCGRLIVSLIGPGVLYPDSQQTIAMTACDARWRA